MRDPHPTPSCSQLKPSTSKFRSQVAANGHSLSSSATLHPFCGLPSS